MNREYKYSWYLKKRFELIKSLSQLDHIPNNILKKLLIIISTDFNTILFNREATVLEALVNMQVGGILDLGLEIAKSMEAETNIKNTTHINILSELINLILVDIGIDIDTVVEVESLWSQLVQPHVSNTALDTVVEVESLWSQLVQPHVSNTALDILNATIQLHYKTQLEAYKEFTTKLTAELGNHNITELGTNVLKILTQIITTAHQWGSITMESDIFTQTLAQSDINIDLETPAELEGLIDSWFKAITTLTVWDAHTTQSVACYITELITEIYKYQAVPQEIAEDTILQALATVRVKLYYLLRDFDEFELKDLDTQTLGQMSGIIY